MRMVSIIVPVYNVAECIEESLQSLLTQTYKDCELIIVDDCGNDDSMEVVTRMLEKGCSFVGGYQILHHDHNRGLSAARNTGLKHAKGEYIYFFDSDDKIVPDCIERLVCKAEDTGADVTMGDILVEGGNAWIPQLKIEGSPFVDENDVIEGNEAVLQAYLSGVFFVMAWNKLMKKTFLIDNDITFKEGLVHEDNPWSLTVACVAKRLAFVRQKTYIYVVRANSLQTDKAFERHFEAYLTILKEFSLIVNTYKSHLSKNVQVQLLGWVERQKALFFLQTKELGTKQQLRQLYAVIRKYLPRRRFSKADVHYFFPASYGLRLYSRFCGYHLL